MYKEQGTKCLICQCEGIKPRKFNLIKTVNQPACGLSNTTGNMLGDFFTKPLQGNVFKNMHKIILNMPDVENTYTEHRSLLGNNTRTVRTEK